VIELRSLPGRWRNLPVTVRDLPLALALILASVLPPLRGEGTEIGDLPSRSLDVLGLAVLALEALPLMIRRRWPLVSFGLVSLGFAADQLLTYHTVAGTALPIALLSAGAHLNHHRRLVPLGATVGYAALAFGLIARGSPDGAVEFVTFYLVVAIGWIVGVWLRQTRAAEAERRRHVEESTRTAERTRIARELHDVVTHHVTAMVVQVEAARYLTAAPERLDDALASVAGTGRRAITDLRHLLDLLNPDHGTGPVNPSVGELGALVEQTRQAGQPVEFTEEGEPPDANGSAEVVAYRVVQEALTNALKYAHGGRTVVHVRHAPREITVEVSNGSGSRAASPGGSGRGLTGLRDRVGALGGEFTAAQQPGGGFRVRACIPTGRAA
jgi:signal transduction histidine kinase